MREISFNLFYAFLQKKLKKACFLLKMLIMRGGNDNKTYLGPTDLSSLVEFINDETGRPKKVISWRINLHTV